MALAGLVLPFIRTLDPERAHNLSIRGLETGLAGGRSAPESERLGSTVFGLGFSNPVGLAAGFDKDGRAPAALFKFGFGFVEVGTSTPRPQPGNPKPRLFRFPRDQAVINRMGFNNEGHPALLARLRGRRFPGPLGVNLGKNKDQTDAIADYVAGIETFAPVADYLAVNVSSPNTPGLRALQDKGALLDLLSAVTETRAKTGNPKIPVLLKIAPDLEEDDIKDIASVVLGSGIDGVIATNTTITRPAEGLGDPGENEPGGLSGKPVFERSTRVLRQLYRETGGAVPLVGAGGVSSGIDAYQKIRSGASLVQLYTALVFHGPGLAARIAEDLDRLLKQDGFESLSDAVGADVDL